MSPPRIELASPLAEPIRQFLAAKRALNRRFDTEERTLRLLDRHLAERGIVQLVDVTSAVIEAFLTSRPRRHPRSYNHLLGVLRRLFDWMLDQGLLDASPIRLRPRRVTARRIPYLFDLPQACRLIEVASALPDNNRAIDRGVTYATIFALLYGLGLRVGEVARLTISDIDLVRNLLVIRGTKFGKSRLVPFGPQMAARLTTYFDLRRRQLGTLPSEAPVFSFTSGQSIHPGTISQTFHALVPRLGLTLSAGWRRRACTIYGTASPSAHCCAGIAKSDPASRLLHLSTFLGHVDPASTAVYLTITVELLEAAGDRFGRYAAPLSTGATP
jgi:site-specific recombinase XerD